MAKPWRDFEANAPELAAAGRACIYFAKRERPMAPEQGLDRW